MQKKSKIFLFVIITSLILSNPTNGNIVNLQSLKTSSVLTNNRIIGNSGWFEFKNDGNCTGSGTYSNTYILRDLVINGSIWIENSSVLFKIENCTVNRVLVLYLTDNNIITENIVTFNDNTDGEDETYDEDELGYENFYRSCLIFLILILSFIGFIILLNILEKFKNK